MRAVVMEGPGRVSVTKVDDPVPGPDDVVLAVGACGLCGTDLALLDGVVPEASYPIVPGHELAGTVVAVGHEVTDVVESDMVAVEPSLSCGTCRYCRSGRSNLCTAWQAHGITSAGGAAEYVRVAAANCYTLPPGTPATAGALIEPLSRAVHGLDRVPHGLTDDVLIYGAGTMGLLMAQVLRRAGVTSLSMVDPRMDLLSAAETMGVRAVALDAEVFGRTEGWDLVVDATGLVSAIEDGLTRVRRAGTFLLLGAATATVAGFSPYRVHRDEITITGSLATHNSFDTARELILSGAINVGPLIADLVDLADYPEALSRLRSGTGLKVQVLPH